MVFLQVVGGPGEVLSSVKFIERGQDPHPTCQACGKRNLKRTYRFDRQGAEVGEVLLGSECAVKARQGLLGPLDTYSLYTVGDAGTVYVVKRFVTASGATVHRVTADGQCACHTFKHTGKCVHRSAVRQAARLGLFSTIKEDK